MSYRFRTVREAKGAVVRAWGELDAYAAPDLQAALQDAATAETVVCDLSAVEFLDSTALGVVVAGFRRACETGVEFAVVLPDGPARRIFELTALDGVIPTVEA